MKKVLDGLRKVWYSINIANEITSKWVNVVNYLVENLQSLTVAKVTKFIGLAWGRVIVYKDSRM